MTNSFLIKRRLLSKVTRLIFIRVFSFKKFPFGDQNLSFFPTEVKLSNSGIMKHEFLSEFRLKPENRTSIYKEVLTFF